ncbi:MAG: helix-turn-helix transcriptional regulator [Propionibacterium sp.]
MCSEFGVQPAHFGDAIVLAANTLCGVEPEGWITTTTLYLDRDYVIDQVFWQNAEQFSDRLDAKQFLDSHCSEPARVIRLGESHAELLMPWLDELVLLCADGLPPDRFYRAQSLVFASLDVIVPRMTVTGHPVTSTRRRAACPSLPRRRQFTALRADARRAGDLLRGELARRWTLRELADAVHLSPSQLGRVFVDAFGKSPIAYLTMLRTERMADLLRTTDAPIARIAREVGWGDPDFAARQFRRTVGITPSSYRAASHERAPQATT